MDEGIIMDEEVTDRSEINSSLTGVSGDDSNRQVVGGEANAIKNESTGNDTNETESIGDEHMDDGEIVDEMQTGLFEPFELQTGARTTVHEKAIESIRSPEPEAKLSEYVYSFEELNLSPQLLHNIRSAYIEKPNHLQQAVIPLLLRFPESHIYIKSRPHSGKKTAFLINLIQRINPNQKATQAIVIAPMAELVYYIAEAAKDLAQNMNVSVLSATVHDPKPTQTVNAHLIVTTIGTFLYLQRWMELNRVKCLVFDETELLMSTSKNIDNLAVIIRKFKDQRLATQLSFFSTSFCDGSLQVIKSTFNLGYLVIRNILTKAFASAFLQFHCYCQGSEYNKKRNLIKLVECMASNRIVVYVLGANRATDLAALLKMRKLKTLLITSCSTVTERLKAIYNFNSSKERVILCINYPACLGIALDDVHVLVNYDLPKDTDYLPIEYMHRISRCNTSNGQQAFIYNLTDRSSKNRLKRVENYFRISMNDLDVDKELHSAWSIQKKIQQA